MINEQEKKLVGKFVIKTKQERYLTFLSKENARQKFTGKLYHFQDFDWRLFREVSGNENVRETIAAEVGKRKISTCYVISVATEYDGKFVYIDEAIEEVIGIEGSILVSGYAEVVYYQGEAPSRRYITL